MGQVIISQHQLGGHTLSRVYRLSGEMFLIDSGRSLVCCRDGAREHNSKNLIGGIYYPINRIERNILDKPEPWHGGQLYEGAVTQNGRFYQIVDMCIDHARTGGPWLGMNVIGFSEDNPYELESGLDYVGVHARGIGEGPGVHYMREAILFDGRPSKKRELPRDVLEEIRGDAKNCLFPQDSDLVSDFWKATEQSRFDACDSFDADIREETGLVYQEIIKKLGPWVSPSHEEPQPLKEIS